MAFHSDIPHFYCYVKAEYLYNLESHHGELIPCLVFGVDSVAGHAIGFEILTNFGGMFARMPISSLCHKNVPNRIDEEQLPLPLEYLEIWDNFSYSIEAHEWAAIRKMRCSVLMKNKKWYDGEYMFTLSWMGDPYAENPGEGGFKRAHIIKLDNGQFAAQPNNRIKWYEASFVTKPFPDDPDFKTNDYVWKCEDGKKWVCEDNDKYFYNYINDLYNHEYSHKYGTEKFLWNKPLSSKKEE